MTYRDGRKHELATRIAILEDLVSVDASVEPRAFLISLPNELPLETAVHIEIADMIETPEIMSQLVDGMRERRREMRGH